MSIFGARRHPRLPAEGLLPGLDGATGWLNSPPLTVAGLRGRVVLVQFWTFTCINWLRTLAYVRAWSERYAEHGLVVIGVHTPEFPFEEEIDNVRRAAADLRVGYPIALDSDYAVWRAFRNMYWPAVYVADADGRIRYHHFGEGEYDECEWVLQRLLRETGREVVGDDLTAVVPDGLEAQADWGSLRSPETYLGSEQGHNLDAVPGSLPLNHWALSGDWTIESRASVLHAAGGRIAFRFHARDVNLVLSPRAKGTSVPFRVLVDGDPPGGAYGLDVGEDGSGTVVEPRLYQLIREPGSIRDRTIEIAFEQAGVEAYVFTFG
jgi:thiol-disulfide isomerase/thioredoxin